MTLDARAPLPFAEAYFDAIFCMNALSFFGGDRETLHRLSPHLRRGGVCCVGGECMSEELPPEQRAHPLDVYSFVDGIWEADVLKLHSPPWWETLIRGTTDLKVVTCREVEDGLILYEDQILSGIAEGYLGLRPHQARDVEIRQRVYGRTNTPYMMIFLLAAQKKGGEG